MPKLTNSIEGWGGRAGGHQPGEALKQLAGVLSKDKPDPMPSQHCANPRCNRIYRPRADGDIYCSEACDLDNNPQYKGQKE